MFRLFIVCFTLANGIRFKVKCLIIFRKFVLIVKQFPL